MMRCSLIIYQPFCHFLSPCYDCVPCSCVRPGIQCGLSVRGTFRVSQTVPVSIRSISLPGLSVWLPLGSPEACLKRAKTLSSRSERSHRSIDPPPRCGRRAAYGLPRAHHTALASQTLSLTRVHPRAPTLSATHSQSCYSIPTPLTLLSLLSGGRGGGLR